MPPGARHTTSLIFGLDFNSNPAIWVGAVVIVAIWIANVFGVRPAVWTGYVTAGALCFPLFLTMFVPYITGDFSTSNLHNNIDLGARLGQRQRPSASSSRGST